ncbi:hypothetical protein UVI_02016600 [Ustilaginoidea virens]|nr:hypothetical protein UVI_02016600 [Ustilaginoidea virens]
MTSLQGQTSAGVEALAVLQTNATSTADRGLCGTCCCCCCCCGPSASGTASRTSDSVAVEARDVDELGGQVSLQQPTQAHSLASPARPPALQQEEPVMRLVPETANQQTRVPDAATAPPALSTDGQGKPARRNSHGEAVDGALIVSSSSQTAAWSTAPSSACPSAAPPAPSTRTDAHTATVDGALIGSCPLVSSSSQTAASTTCSAAPLPSSPPPVVLPNLPIKTDALATTLDRPSPGRSRLSPSDRAVSVVKAGEIEHDHDVQVQGHRVLRLKPTAEQWADFPAVLAHARSLGADADGCFKVATPPGLHGALPETPAQHVAANTYKVRLVRRSLSWQVSTAPSRGAAPDWSQQCPPPPPQFADSAEAAFKALKQLFRKSQNRQLRNIRYRVDVPAWTETQRRLAGVPERSPIHPLKGDKLDHTKAVIPGIHTPYVYESGPYFGATFQIHAEDFRLASLNHLYKGRKIWVVVPATAVDVAEEALGRGSGCSQFMRHRAEFFFPDKLDKLGIPYRIVDQRPGETIVILPDAYHEGFSCGYTIAEAKNYADTAWTTDSYQPCQASCRLATAIPAAFMRPLARGEDRLDLCAAYGDGLHALAEASSANGPGSSPAKRDCQEVALGCPSLESKRIKV